MNDLTKRIIRIVLIGVGLGSLTMLIYMAGPFISIGGFRPLEGYIGRSIALLLLAGGIASFSGFKFWQRKKTVDGSAVVRA